MNSPAFWLLLFGNAVALWWETGENPALFCYRIGWDLFSNLRERALVPIPVMRAESLCWNRSATCFTRSSMSKD